MMKYIFYMLTIAWVTGADWLTPICYRKSTQAGTVVTPNWVDAMRVWTTDLPCIKTFMHIFIKKI